MAAKPCVHFRLLSLFVGLAWQASPAACVDRPNLIWFLTDDQDQVLGGAFPPTLSATPMPKTKKLLQDEGIHARHWYIHTPICSPSRAELLSGRYFHNIKMVGAADGSDMHVNNTIPNTQSFVRILKEQGGYNTGMFGKYLNAMPDQAPPGYDAWFANDGGTFISPSFQVKGIEGLPDGNVTFTADAANYSTSVIGNYSIQWMRKVAKEDKPFFAYIATKAAHEPFNPAVWYADYWDPSWPDHEPRDKAWNSSAASRADHHGNIATEHLITKEASQVITGVFKNRWRTLMSVDDLIADVVKFVEEELGAGNRTYFMYSSDHGFQLGQFNIPIDKRHVYEWDTKIHLLARGPGIKAGSSFSKPGTQVDIAPTMLGLAGIKAPSRMDGWSIVPFLLEGDDESVESSQPLSRILDQTSEPIILLQEGSRKTHPLLPSTRKHLDDLGDLAAYRQSWRSEVFIEHYYVARNIKCMTGCEKKSGGPWPEKDSHCMDLKAHKECFCNAATPMKPQCYAVEDPNNNYIALRRPTSATENIVFAEFQEGNLMYENIDFTNISFTEQYDLSKDPWELNNLAFEPSMEPKRVEYRARLRKWLACSGSSCP